jgi:hypothetical protein
MTTPTASSTSSSTDIVAFDPFDPANLRLDQDFLKMAGAKKLLTTVPVRRPNKQDYIRVHSAEEYRMLARLIEFKEDGETFMVTPPMSDPLVGEWFPAMVYTAINRQGVVFLWPVKLPNAQGKTMDWHRTAHEAAQHAMFSWIRVVANKSLGAYETIEGPKTIPAPEWPDLLPLKELLRIAFRDRLVDSLDHPAVKRLQGH